MHGLEPHHLASLSYGSTATVVKLSAVLQGHAANPTQRIWTGSTVQNPLMQPRQLELQQQRGIVCQGLFGLGLPEIAVIAGVTALIFGPSKLPELGKGLGKTVKSFQTAAKEFKTELEQAAAADEEPAAAGKEADKAASSKKE